MPLYLTASHSSRIQKSSTASQLRQSSSSPFASHPRSKTSKRNQILAKTFGNDTVDQELEPTGKTFAVVPSRTPVVDVVSAMARSKSSMFCDIPDRAGFNSTKTAQVLNFRRDLPPVVSLAHVHALISASSKTERQISALLTDGHLRKVLLNGRGNDISGTSELLITTEDLTRLLGSSSVLPETIAAFRGLLTRNPRATSFTSGMLQVSHLTSLVRAGFLVSSSLSNGNHASLSGSSLVSMPTISRAASGSSAAVGGEAAFEHLGGVGVARRASEPVADSSATSTFVLSVPNLGPFLRLLNASRAYLLEILSKSRLKEAPLYLLRERWDGAVDSDSRPSMAKQIRGEFSQILPAKTKKWKTLHGVNFDWALEECLGAGLIELFETRSVGLGVRALG